MHCINGSIRKKNILPGLVAAALAGWASTAGAIDFETESGWTGSWINTFSLGSTWRAHEPDPKLFTGADGARIGLTGGTAGSVADAGDLNYRKHDRITTIAKVLTELEVKKGDMGGLLRAKLWYDQASKHRSVPYGHISNGYAQNAPLSDDGLEKLQQFDGAYLLDAYVYDTFKVADLPLQARLGRQVLNWGESLFLQGVNQTNPLDLGVLRRPGAELKEALLPQWMASANMGLGGGKSLEAFYQFKWENTSVDGCGAYWAVTETVISTSPGKCIAGAVVPSPISTMSAPTAFKNGLYAPLVEGKKAKNSGQFGLSYRFPVDALDAEIGLYAMNIHARTPIISAKTGTPLPGTAASGGLINPVAAQSAMGLKPATAFWEYPEDIHVVGISGSTNLAGWSVGSELSYSADVPVQRNSNDLLAATLKGVGPLGAIAKSATAQGPGTVVSGYDRFHKIQYQANAVSAFSNVLGAQQATVAGEVGFQRNNVPDFNDPTSIRYGRGPIFGSASHPLMGGSTCKAAVNPSEDGCLNDGFVTRFAWGYRLKGQLEYSNVFSSGVTAYPNASFAHDVKGYSMDGQFLQDRKQLGLGVRFVYQKQYTLDLNYTTFNHNAKYDPLRDRDYYGVTLSATF
jgi:hypothetical protein